MEFTELYKYNVVLTWLILYIFFVFKKKKKINTIQLFNLKFL